MNFSTADLIVFIGYLLIMIGIGIWFARKKNESTQDYFLASSALPWWAVGGSLIASNISTEQILGMNGSGFEIGLAIASYELMAAATLLLVAKFFLPVFISKGIYTMPQFLEQRFDNRVRSALAIFWIFLFVFVNITSVLYLGGLAIENIMGIPLMFGIAGLVIYSASFSIFGGLKAVVWTDVIQVIILIAGGFTASYLVVRTVGGGHYFDGLLTLLEEVPNRFKMVFSKSDQYLDISTGTQKSAYSLLPGLSVLLGGMWIANIYYWGTNQYIIQRALAARDLNEAQKGVAFAAFLKILMPLIVVIPGIAAFYLQADISKADEAFPWVLNNYVSQGLKGLVFAALIAAIGSSISSMVNSTSTIFTLDIYKQLNSDSSEQKLVRVGKISAATALIIGAVVAPMLQSLGQVFQYIQEYTGFISPGIVAIFIFGLFWKPTTANAAIIVIILSIPLSWVLQVFFPELPFIDRMGFCFLLLSTILVVLSVMQQTRSHEMRPRTYQWGILMAITGIATVPGIKILIQDGWSSIFGILSIALSVILSVVLLTENKVEYSRSIQIPQNLFKTSSQFNIAAVFTLTVLAIIYIIFW
jgi:solute:Na+ symporter, SSS family